MQGPSTVMILLMIRAEVCLALKNWVADLNEKPKTKGIFVVVSSDATTMLKAVYTL